ncbi:MAG TPA: flagellar motor protein MotS [Bacillota bacterium]|nr:flagellar motor protein MotS [Bacillota bacterium]
MKRRYPKRRKPSGAPKWMVTYSDMITLILVFFILLFSMSQIDLAKFEAVSESFRNRMIFDFYPSPVPMENPTEHSSHLERGKNTNEFKDPTDLQKVLERDHDNDDENDALGNLMEEVEAYLDEKDLHDVISAHRTERGVVLVLQERVLFDTGEAVIRKSGKTVLDKIGYLLADIPNRVEVEGHTDSRPIANYRYPSNWELSGARASRVIRYLLEKYDFDKSRFSAVGYADTQPRVPNDSADNWQKNRRVEIVILDE